MTAFSIASGTGAAVTDGGGRGNLVTNGGFDVDASWVKGAGVTIAGGVANLAAGSGYLEQGIATVAGGVYQVSATATGNPAFCGAWDNAGQSAVLSGSAGGRGPGAFTFNFTASDATSFLGFTASGLGALSLDNVSARRIG